MCSQENENGEFWKEESRRSFPSLESVYTDEEEPPTTDVLNPNTPFIESTEIVELQKDRFLLNPLDYI